MNNLERQRMCISCRQKKDKGQLIRIVKLPSSDFEIDPTYVGQGRGAYICKNAACLAKCIKVKMLNKAFKCSVPQNIYDILRGLNEQ